MPSHADPRVLVGRESFDDAGIFLLRDDLALVQTVDFFAPIVDDPYDWGRIAAANALSDVYAIGGRPLVAVNLLAWPRGVLPFDLAREVLRGGLDVAAEAGCHVGGGHSVDDPEPKYGMAVTGVADPARLLRNDAAVAGMPISLTKPLGVGMLNNRHKSTGEVFPQAVASMVALNARAAQDALAAGVVAATDVTGFGLLGHLFKMARASGVSAVVDAAAVPYLDGAREALDRGAWPTGWDGVTGLVLHGVYDVRPSKLELLMGLAAACEARRVSLRVETPVGGSPVADAALAALFRAFGEAVRA